MVLQIRRSIRISIKLPQTNNSISQSISSSSASITRNHTLISFLISSTFSFVHNTTTALTTNNKAIPLLEQKLRHFSIPLFHCKIQRSRCSEITHVHFSPSLKKQSDHFQLSTHASRDQSSPANLRFFFINVHSSVQNRFHLFNVALLSCCDELHHCNVVLIVHLWIVLGQSCLSFIGFNSSLLPPNTSYSTTQPPS
eukprot:TRINITY_DN19178_c0_g1_i1.p1 TRINITY_DN19178_c0_g1~~TRINITY_DN19178_c0_g1_i1.p1  ORF type:complete len:197 (+),score=21.20 TRINITY_DN19178_c0_g1_i1:166-756(+)